VAEQQSATVRDQRVDVAAVRQAIAAVDAIDRELGADLGTTERWSRLRQGVLDVSGRRFADPSDGYVVYTELLDTAIALTRKVGDSSNLILDPQLDTYYVMNAGLLRIPDVMVDAGRYADLLYLLVQRKDTNQLERVGQLSTARLDVVESSADLADGLEKAFGGTQSDALGPALLRPLDNFKTSVDALAPRASPLTPASTRLDPTVVSNANDDLQRTALELDRVVLDQLDQLVGKRITAAVRGLVVAGVGLVLGVVLLATAAAVWLRRAHRDPPPPPPVRTAGSRHGDRRDPDSVDARELVASSGLTFAPRRGGTRAAR